MFQKNVANSICTFEREVDSRKGCIMQNKLVFERRRDVNNGNMYMTKNLENYSHIVQWKQKANLSEFRTSDLFNLSDNKGQSKCLKVKLLKETKI